MKDSVKKKLVKKVTIFVLCISCCLNGCNNDIGVKKDVIGIIGAMDVEVESLKETMNVKEITEVAGAKYYIGTIGKREVVVVKCDMGKVHAGSCTTIMIHKFGCTKIINTGVAGSLDRNIKMGDIVVSTEAVQHDFDARPIGYEIGEIPYTGLVSFKADEELVNEMYNVASEYNDHTKAYKGRVCTGDQFIASREKLEEIVSNFGGLCCDMEGGAIAQVCYLNKVPFAIIRVISDMPGDTEISEYQENEADFSLKCARIVEKVMLKDAK